MDNLISRAAAIAAFDDERVDRYYGDVSPESVIRVIESLPAVDTAPVVHGRWKWDMLWELYFCSKCGGGECWTPTKYCPDCGARMDGEQRDEDGTAD